MDLSSNLSEWVDWSSDAGFTIADNTKKAYDATDGGPTSTNIDFPNIDTNIASSDPMKPDTWQPTTTAADRNNGVGTYFAGGANAGGAAHRGGWYTSGIKAGLYYLSITRDTTSTAKAIGFRCVYKD